MPTPAAPNRTAEEAQEAARLDALRSLNVWDVVEAPELDRITSLVAESFGMPTVLVSFVGKYSQRFLSRVGFDRSETERDLSICAIAIEQKEVFVVDDLSQDPRFIWNRLVRDDPGFRFYAGAPLVTASGHAVGTLCVLDTVTRAFTEEDRRRLSAFAALVLDQISLRQLVGRRDPVTGLPNLQQFNADLQALVDQQFTGRRTVAVIDVSDIPTGGRLAQAMGTEALQSVIREVAARVEQIMRHYGTLYHIGATRFALIVPMYMAQESRALRRKVIAAVEGPLYVGNIALRPACHAGVTLVQKNTAADALRRAITAAQDAYDDSVTWRGYDRQRDASMRRQYQLASDVHDAAQDNQFYLMYQPRVDLTNNSIRGAEALIRWRHPQFGELLPGEFIPILERTNSMRVVTDWVTREACRQASEWDRAGVLLPLSINVSAGDFDDGWLVERVMIECERFYTDPRCIEVEITEGQWLDGRESVIHQLGEMKEAGLRVAIDDFGVGYSNFSYLFTIPVDTLKIDQALVRGFLHNKRQLAMLRGIIRLCKQLKLDVVAEGIESEEERAALRDLGCATGQGFYFARPMMPDDFLKLVKERGLSAGRFGE